MNELSEATEDDSYKDLAEVEEGERLKIVISNIHERENDWSITAEVYKGKDLSQRGNDFKTLVYRQPEDLVEEVLISDAGGINSLFFFPIDVKDYLSEFEEIAKEDEEYYEKDYELIVDDKSLIFDYTFFGYLDTYVQEYNSEGILELFKILSSGKTAFKMELINSYEDYSNIIFAVIICSISSMLLTSFFILRKKRSRKPLDSKDKINKMLSKVK